MGSRRWAAAKVSFNGLGKHRVWRDSTVALRGGQCGNKELFWGHRKPLGLLVRQKTYKGTRPVRTNFTDFSTWPSPEVIREDSIGTHETIKSTHGSFNSLAQKSCSTVCSIRLIC